MFILLEYTKIQVNFKLADIRETEHYLAGKINEIFRQFIAVKYIFLCGSVSTGCFLLVGQKIS